MPDSKFLITRRAAASLCVATVAALPFAAVAQDAWPARAVRVVVSFPAGGAVDVLARDVAQRLGALWGQPVVVDNKPGANGVIAADMVAKAAPDGYTLFFNHDGIGVLPYVQSAKLPFDPVTDFRPIGMVAHLPVVLVASPAAGIGSLPQLIAAAKKDPDAIAYASNGAGGTLHMAMESLQRAAGIKLQHIPYKGSGPAMQDIMGGRVHVMWAAVASAMPHIKAGKLVPIAYGSRHRSSVLAQVPTVSELGFANYQAMAWFALVGPARMPEALAQRINADLRKVLQDRAFIEDQATKGNEVSVGSPEDLARLIRSDSERNNAMAASGVFPKE